MAKAPTLKDDFWGEKPQEPPKPVNPFLADEEQTVQKTLTLPKKKK